MRVFHRLGYDWKNLPRRQRAVSRCRDGRYDGWTGYEHFGVITPYRYYGWTVTCWATVMAEAYGSARRNRFFLEFDDAVSELDLLMDVANTIDRLSHRPVEYAEIERKMPLWIGSLIPISNILVSDEKAPDSPASQRRHERRFGGHYPKEWLQEAEFLYDHVENVSRFGIKRKLIRRRLPRA